MMNEVPEAICKALEQLQLKSSYYWLFSVGISGPSMWSAQGLGLPLCLLSLQMTPSEDELQNYYRIGCLLRMVLTR